METFKAYILRNFEQFFVLVILITIAFINYFVPQKISFLNFYFLPVILAGYYLGFRRSVLGALLCILLVITYAWLYPQFFAVPAEKGALYYHILVWGGFLILSGAVVGKLQEKLTGRIAESHSLNSELNRQQFALKSANIAVKETNENLDNKIQERTHDLEKSRETLETLKTRVEDTLYTTIDSSVARLITEGRLRNERRKLSILFSNLEGFNAYAEKLDPESVVRDLNLFLDDMESILARYQGHLERLTGNGIISGFGVPLHYDNYRLLAALAAIKMQEKMRSGNHPWKMRIGISSGSAITGMIGTRRRSYTTIGNTVNISSRLEKQCTPGSILTDKNTMEGIQPYIDAHLREDLSGGPGKEEDYNHEKAIFEITGIRDVLLDRRRISPSLYDKYRHTKDLISIPEDVILPVEALDGSIGHGRIVSLLSYAIASQMGVSELDSREILHAAFVADIGKESIPQHILMTGGPPGKHDPEEIKRHPTEAPGILKKMGYDSELMLQIIRHSHENMDGSGYPDGLRGDHIPTGSRIVAVADAYDTLISRQRNGKKYDLNTVPGELKKLSQMGKLDSRVVDTLIQIMN